MREQDVCCLLSAKPHGQLGGALGDILLDLVDLVLQKGRYQRHHELVERGQLAMIVRGSV